MAHLEDIEKGNGTSKLKKGKLPSCCNRLTCRPPPEDVEDLDNLAVLSSLSQTLFMFLIYFQELGLLIFDNVDYSFWEDYFGWIDDVSFNIDFDFDVLEGPGVAGILLGTYLFPVFLIHTLHEQVAYVYAERTSKIAHILYLIVGISMFIGAIAAAILVDVQVGYLIAIPALYFIAAFVYRQLKIKYTKWAIKRGESQGVGFRTVQQRVMRNEISLILSLMTLSFATVTGVWLRLAILGDDIIIQVVGGILGFLLLIYMMTVITFSDKAASKIFPGNTNYVPEGIDKYISILVFGRTITTSFAYKYLNFKREFTFRKRFWFTQTIFAMERFALVFVGSFLEGNVEEGEEDVEENVNNAIAAFIIISVAALYTIITLPYKTATDNRMEFIPRVSNIILIGTAIANSLVATEEAEIATTSILLANSGLMALFWVFYFSPKRVYNEIKEKIEDTKTTVEKLKAEREWRKIKTIGDMEAKVVSLENQELSNEEWEVLTMSQIFKSLLVEREGEIEKKNTNTFEIYTKTAFREEDVEILRKGGLYALTALKNFKIDERALEEEDVPLLQSSGILNQFSGLRSFTLMSSRARHSVLRILDIVDVSRNKEVTFTLTTLKITGCLNNLEGAEAIANYLRSNSRLECLYLDENKISDKCGSIILEALAENKSVTELNLNVNFLSTMSMEALAVALETNTTLFQIDLLSNRINREGIEIFFESVSKSESLSMLNIREQRVQVTERLFDDEENWLGKKCSEETDKDLINVADNATAKCVLANPMVMVFPPGFVHEGKLFDIVFSPNYNVAEEGFKEELWLIAERGLCCVIASWVSQSNIPSEILNSKREGTNETMLELVLTKGVSYVAFSANILVEAGADINCMNSSGDKSLLLMARESNDQEVREWADSLEF